MTEPLIAATPQAPGAPEPVVPAAPATPEVPKPGDPADVFKSEESKNAVLADLKKEREARQSLQEQFEAQNKAIAAAFGLTEAPKAEDLAETVKTLREEIATDRRAALIDRLAAANGIDAAHQVLLTETDPEKLAAQAVMVGALVKAQTAGDGTPEFQANPGQGQSGTPATAAAASAAEYDTYYPTPNRK